MPGIGSLVDKRRLAELLLDSCVLKRKLEQYLSKRIYKSASFAKCLGRETIRMCRSCAGRLHRPEFVCVVREDRHDGPRPYAASDSELLCVLQCYAI